MSKSNNESKKKQKQEQEEKPHLYCYKDFMVCNPPPPWSHVSPRFYGRRNSVYEFRGCYQALNSQAMSLFIYMCLIIIIIIVPKMGLAFLSCISKAPRIPKNPTSLWWCVEDGCSPRKQRDLGGAAEWPRVHPEKVI